MIWPRTLKEKPRQWNYDTECKAQHSHPQIMLLTHIFMLWMTWVLSCSWYWGALCLFYGSCAQPNNSKGLNNPKDSWDKLKIQTRKMWLGNTLTCACSSEGGVLVLVYSITNIFYLDLKIQYSLWNWVHSSATRDTVKARVIPMICLFCSSGLAFSTVTIRTKGSYIFTQLLIYSHVRRKEVKLSDQVSLLPSVFFAKPAALVVSIGYA